MEIVWFTVVGIVLYLAADLILTRIEAWRGALLPHRSLVFFGILMSMALVTFAVMRNVAAP